MNLSPRRNLLAMLFVASLSGTPTQCATTMDSAATSQDQLRVACQSFVPIKWSKQDTTLTIAQVREHNAAGIALCGWK